MPIRATGARFSGVAISLAAATALLIAGCGSDSSSSADSTEAASDSGKVRVAWQEPANEEDAFGYELLTASETEKVATSLAEGFELPNRLTVRGVNGAGGGPFYDPERNSITLPYGFATLIYDIESSFAGNERELGEQVGAVNSFILAHEFAHALIENYELPVLGKEEDAADSIATAVLLQIPEGDTFAADAAAFWANFSGRQEPPALADYAGNHALDLQRAFSIMCWVAGSGERAYEEVAELEVLPPERLESCPEEYEQLVTSIDRLLDPHLEDDAGSTSAE